MSYYAPFGIDLGKDIADAAKEQIERIAKYEATIARVKAENPGKDWKADGFLVNEYGDPILYRGEYPIKDSKTDI